MNKFPKGIYDSPKKGTRHRMDVDDLDNYLDSQRTSYVYTHRGYIIDTHEPDFAEDSQPCGILIKANELAGAFASRQPDAIDFDMLDEYHSSPSPSDFPEYPTQSTKFYFYPQAGLRNIGHFQAAGLMTECYPIVSRINTFLRHQNDNEDYDMDAPGAEFYYGRNPVIHPISSQGYNAVMHHTRGRGAQHHDAQLALVTAALAGQWAPEHSPCYNTAHRIMEECKNQLPHQSYEKKIKSHNINRDLRLENVYCFDLMALHPARRTGE
jgi:hypothetical protein